MSFQAQHLLAAYKMEARRRMEFTKNSRVVATIDQIDRLRLPRGRAGPLHGHRYPRLHAGHVAPAAGAAIPTPTRSLTAQWIWWKEQRDRTGRRCAARDAGAA